MGTTLNGIRYPELVGVSADVPRDMKALAEDVDDRIYLVGEIRWLGGAAPSAKWLACDGLATYSRTTYVKLWNYLRAGHAGTAGDPAPWGNGDGSTTFAVPDLRGRTPVGPGAAVGGGVEASPPNRLVGTKWGANAVLLTDPRQNATHNHGNTGVTNIDHYHYPTPGAAAFLTTVFSVGDGGDAGAMPYWAADGPSVGSTGGMIQNITHAHTTQDNGGGMTHENAPPSVAIPVYIYAGV